MQKSIVLISGSRNTKDHLYSQLKEFIPEYISICCYASEENIPDEISADLIIYSSDNLKNEISERGIKLNCKDYIISERSINFDYIELVANIPPKTEVLLVNDEKETTYSSIEDLMELGLNHIKYYPYYPGIERYKKLNIAITPGESDKVPDCVEKVIDLGPRIMDINTLYNIMDKLNFDNKDTRFFTKRYMQKIINVSKNISLVNNNINTLNTYLNNIVDSLVNGILVIDENGYIKYANEQMTKLLSPDKRNIENRNVKNLVDKEALKYFMSADFYENKDIEISGSIIKTSKFKIPNSDNVVITTSKEKKANSKSKFTQDLLLKGHFAKYDFEDIIGNSYQINEVKLTAFKLSKSELTVLIEGESGTGKELFASAIHNTSNRKDGPYLAVNFSALPDELIESELFGYEEGAFTGAKKGGKIGLFELADGGTIFLDEIGDISLKVQTKLLRVLQEKEIMPVGGTKIKSVDVRVIAATNKDLRKMVKEKQFRSDLYYRLKIGYIHLPPLRERISDIKDLVEYFISKETSKKVKISKEVIDDFESYKWLGNVRELESTIKYMLAVRTTDTLTLDDLPDKKFFEEEVGEDNCDSDYEFKILSGELLSILNMIKKLEDNNINASREKITKALNDIGIDVTENKIRTKLNYLEEYGYITKNRGKKGTVLTRKGLGYLNSMILEGE